MMGMFGALKRKPMFGEIPGMGQMQPPMAQPQPQVGAMDPNTQAMTKKPGFFAQGQPGRQIIGVIGDTLATLGGGQGVYMPAMLQQQQQDAEIRARLQEAIAKRKAEREDYTWKAEYDRANPKPTNPHYWETNDGSLGRIGPDGNPEIVYKDPTDRVVFQPDGLGGGRWITQPSSQSQNLIPIGGILPPKGGPVQQAPVTFSGQ